MQTISVVIPTLDRAQLLSRTIECIQTQTISSDRYEVIVVDNNSSDNTPQVLAEQADRYPNLRFIRELRSGAAAARNRGLQHAEGDLVLFIDDDIEADPQLIEAHLDAHARNPEASVVGTIRTQWENIRDPFLRYLRDQRIYNPYSLRPGAMDYSCYHTGNVSTPRDMLYAAGGFDERFEVYGMEDIELGYRLERLGSRLVSGADAIGTHIYCPTFAQFGARCEQAGFSLGLMLRLHPELRGRFTGNSSLGRVLRPFHNVYRAALPLIEPAAAALGTLEEKKGTGAVSSLLAAHYGWALRYRFYVGYSDYLNQADRPLAAIQTRPAQELKVKEPASKIESSSVVSS